MSRSTSVARKLASIGAALGCAGLVLGCAAPAASAPPGWQRHESNKPYSIQQTGPERLRFEVHADDKWDRDKNPVNRSELKGQARYAAGTDVWFSYQVRVLSGPPDNARWCVIGQFHQTSDPWDGNASPPFAIELMRGSEKLRVMKRYTPDRATTSTINEVVYQGSPIQRDRWVHIVGHVVFGWNNDGTVELWIDGRKVVDLPHTSIGYNDVLGPYWKFGIYRAQTDEPLAVEYANMEIGQSSLLSRVGHPLPIR